MNGPGARARSIASVLTVMFFLAPTLAVAGESRQRVEFPLHQEARVRGKIVRQADGRRVRTMQGRERVVHEYASQTRKLSGERRFVRRLLSVKPNVLQQEDVPGTPAAISPATSDPTQSGSFVTARPSSASSRSEIGSSWSSGTNLPSGRPR